MTNRLSIGSKSPLRRVPAALVFVGVLVWAGAEAQPASDGDWVVPRTSAGHPVLEGYWTSSTVVPLQRPAELGEQAFYTPEQATAFVRERLQTTEPERGTDADVHYDLSEYGLGREQSQMVDSLRTSLIVDPANGRLPALTAEAEARAAARAEHRRMHGFDSAQDRPLAERCIWWRSAGPPMLPVGYNSNYQIVQTPDYLVILLEMIHDARIIPLGDDPGLPADVRQYLGVSRGHWDGDTLVVETSNLTEHTAWQGSSEQMTVVERFTRVSEDSIEYEFTVTDDATWERPWTAAVPLARIDGPMFEYACHEGNYGIANTLSGARTDERAAASEN